MIRKAKPDPTLSLATLFEAMFAPECLSSKAAANYRPAVRQFSSSLGRAATLGDLTPLRLNSFYEWCIERYFRTGRIEGYRAALRAIAVFASERGLIEGVPIMPAIAGEAADKPSRPSWNEPGTVAYYFAHVFKPDVLETYRPTTILKYDAAVRAWLRFVGNESSIDCLTPDRIERFEKWLGDAAGYSHSNVDRYPRIMRQIMRHWRPELATPPKSRKFVEADAPPGSVRWFYDSRFLAEHGVRHSTELWQRACIRRFSEFVGREAMLSDFAPLVVNGYIVKRLGEWKASTVHTEAAALLTLWRAAYDWELVDDPPKRIRKVRCPIIIPDAFTPVQVASLFAACGRTEVDVTTRGGQHVGRFFLAMLMAAYDSGLRTSDLLAVRYDQLNADGRILVTMEKTGFPHVAEVRDATRVAIEAAAMEGDDRLLPWPHNKKCFHYWRKQIWRAAGIKPHRRNGLQKLRRTSASYVEAMTPGAATAHLGHKSPGLARRHYLDPLITSRSTLPPAIDVKALLEGPKGGAA
jgi:integrase